MQLLRVLILAPLIAACGVGNCTPSFDAIPVEQEGFLLGIAVDDVDVECRRIDAERCRRGAIQLADNDALRGATRIVISCVGQCDARGGELRMDVVTGAAAALVGNGGYGEFEQSCGTT
jgi:hypothetical protein